MMENGVEVVEGSHTEGKLMENDGLDSVVENNNIKPAESDGSEEGEVFEEAVDAEIPLDRVHDVVTNGDDIVNVNGDELSSDHAKVDDKAGPENDFDNFEETIGVPLSVVIEQEELPVQVPANVEDSAETSMGSELDGGVDEAENPPKDELGEHEKIVQISPYEQEGGDISDANPSGEVGNPGDVSDINPTGEVGSPRDGNQTEKNSEIVSQVGENGVQESVSLPEIGVQENSDVGNTTEISVKADEQPEAGGDSDSVPAKSPGENVFQDENGEEGKESLGLSDTDHKDREILVKEDLVVVDAVEGPEAGDSVIVSGGDSGSVFTNSPEENLYQDANGEDGKESLGLSDNNGHKDSEILVKEDVVVSDSHTDREPEVKDQSVNIDMVHDDDQIKDLKEETSSSPVHLDANGMKELKVIASLGLESQDGGKLDLDSASADSNHLGANGESEKKTLPTAEEPEVTPEADILPTSDDSGVVKADEETEKLPVSEDAAIVEIVEKMDDLPTPRDSPLVDTGKTIGAADPDVVVGRKFEGSQNEGVVDKDVEGSQNEVVVDKDFKGSQNEVVVDKDVEGSQNEVGVDKDFKGPQNEVVVDKDVEGSQNEVGVDKDFKDPQNEVVVDKDVEGSQNEVVVDKDVEASTVEIKEPETKGVIHEEVRQNVQGTREAEIKPAAVFLPSRKPADQNPTPARPAGLGGAAPLLEPSRVAQQSRVNGTSSHVQAQLVEDPSNGETEENDETREKLQMIRVKFLRLAHRLGQTPHNVVVAQVLYRLGLAEQLRGRNGGRVGAFSFDRASAMAEHLEAAGQEPLDFSCTIMVLGKSGVGKSATINSIFDEAKFGTDAFQLGTKKVQDVVGTVQGIKVRVIDTPGLLPSWSDQRQNEKILHSVKRFIKKTPPDIVLYLDRLDMQSRDFGDMPLLRTITDIFGTSIWFNAIVVLTHAASAPPEGPNGTATSYDMFVTQRSHVVQQAIRQAAGDMRLMNPVSLVENHSACRINRAGQRVLPNGQVWKPHLLLLSFASKILAEANTLLKLQDSPPGRPFATRTRAPPLPFLLSSLLQSRPQLKLPEEQFGDDDDTLDDDLDESSDSDDESAYDDLPPFKRLSKAQLAKLTKAQKRAYHDELEYREKLFMKKQLKEEKKRRRFMKKMADSAKDLPSDYGENVEEESGGAASVPVAMPDLALPASFDSDNPTHRYRYLDSPNQWVVRPVLDTHGWDHDIGYEGVNVEKVFVVKQEIPVSFSGQVTKDKKDSNLQMEISSSVKHGKDKATSLGLDMQTLGKDMVYTLRSETRFSNYRQNKATAGLSVTMLGDALTAGVKIEDKLIVNKRFRMVVSGGAMAGRGDVAYGGSLEATLRDKDHPLGRSLTTLGLSVMDWHGDLAIGGNLQSQIPIGRSTNLIARANLNNRSSGQVSIRLNSSEQLQIALVALLPLLRKLYPQQLQFGQ